MPTKSEFLAKLRAELAANYAWAKNEDKLNAAMVVYKDTIEGQSNLAGITGDVFVAVWKSFGMKGKPTYKGLRALPDA